MIQICLFHLFLWWQRSVRNPRFCRCVCFCLFFLCIYFSGNFNRIDKTSYLNRRTAHRQRQTLRTSDRCWHPALTCWGLADGSANTTTANYGESEGARTVHGLIQSIKQMRALETVQRRRVDLSPVPTLLQPIRSKYTWYTGLRCNTMCTWVLFYPSPCGLPRVTIFCFYLSYLSISYSVLGDFSSFKCDQTNNIWFVFCVKLVKNH